MDRRAVLAWCPPNTTVSPPRLLCPPLESHTTPPFLAKHAPKSAANLPLGSSHNWPGLPHNGSMGGGENTLQASYESSYDSSWPSSARSYAPHPEPSFTVHGRVAAWCTTLTDHYNPPGKQSLQEHSSALPRSYNERPDSQGRPSGSTIWAGGQTTTKSNPEKNGTETPDGPRGNA